MSDNKSSNANSSTASRTRKADIVSDEEAQSLKLNKAIAEFNKNVGLMDKAVKDAKEVAETYLNDFDDKVKLKKRKVDDMEEDFKLQYKNKELELNNNIKESGYTKAVEILAARNPKEIAVQENVYLALQSKVAQLEREMKQSIADEVAKHKAALDRDFKYNEETSKLRASNETAKIQAQVQQKSDHINVLLEQVASLKHEIDCQRKLTESISQSFSQISRPNVVSTGDGFNNSNNRR